MDADGSNLESIFEKAREIESPEERARYLSEACGDDLDLFAAVEVLLRDYLRLGQFLEAPACPPGTTTVDSVIGKGSTIGRYKLLEEIGHGGMGIVYMAEEPYPLRRLVALKLIKPGMNSSSVVARFEAERTALTQMKHQNIAAIFDAGSTATGQPYFVMELIRGQKITDYCDTHKLSIRERLGLFIQVCDAVQHLHKKAIIHRDLKPANILVTLQDGSPVSKVIDFGVAKTLGQPLTEKTLVTGFNELVGTLLYMSPEQANLSGLEIDTTSDIYSLGVLLYQLIAGSLPFQQETLESAGIREILRMICDDDPPTPSNRLNSLGLTLTSVSLKRGVDSRQLKAMVSGEIDWVVMKALQKKPRDRYQHAEELSKEIQSHLMGQGVQAGPQTLLYRVKRYGAKHRTALIAIVGSGIVLLLATIISAGMAFRAIRSEGDARSVQTFFRERVLAAQRPEGQEGGLAHDLTLRATLDAAEPAITTEFAGRPVVEADVRDTLGLSYWYLGEPALAIKQLDRAYSLRKIQLGIKHPDTLTSLNNLASAYSDQGNYDQALLLAREAFEARTSVLGPTHPDTLTSQNNLASDLKLDGKPAEAIPLFEQVLSLRQSTLGRDDPTTVATMDNLAMAYFKVKRIDEAQKLLKQALELRQSKVGMDHLDTLVILDNLAVVYSSDGKSSEAIAMFEKALAIRKMKLPPGHPRTLGTMNNLAATCWNAGQKDRAIAIFEEALPLQRKRLGFGHPATILLAYNLAICCEGNGQHAKAIPLLEEALAFYRIKPGPDDEETLTTMNNLAGAYLGMNRCNDAEGLLRECLAIRGRAGFEKWERFLTRSQLGAALQCRGNYSEAESLLIDGYEGLTKRESDIPPRLKKHVAESAARIVSLYEAWGKPDKAAEWRVKLSPAPAGFGPKP